MLWVSFLWHMLCSSGIFEPSHPTDKFACCKCYWNSLTHASTLLFPCHLCSPRSKKGDIAVCKRSHVCVWQCFGRLHCHSCVGDSDLNFWTLQRCTSVSIFYLHWNQPCVRPWRRTSCPGISLKSRLNKWHGDSLNQYILNHSPKAWSTWAYSAWTDRGRQGGSLHCRLRESKTIVVSIKTEIPIEKHAGLWPPLLA